MTGNAGKVDVLINVCGKPYQTALALLTLERECGQHIDTIYFVEENTATRQVDADMGRHGYILEALRHKIVHFIPPQWHYCFALEPEKLQETAYRHSIRYQYGWEMTDKEHILIIHNDITFHGDVIGAMLNAIGDHAAIGHVGQCWYCPAAFAGLCDSTRHMEYRPSFRELADLYKRTDPPPGSVKRAYQLPRWHTMFVQQPWPLPECRVNEWCALVNMKLARRLTIPQGRVTPFGAIVNVGKQILDVGCQWFRELHLRGHHCAHFDISPYAYHDVPPTGQPTLLDQGRYLDREQAALERLRTEFGLLTVPEVAGEQGGAALQQVMN
ncbi:hypothetical protein [Megalodesulfovibrio paquesii]